MAQAEVKQSKSQPLIKYLLNNELPSKPLSNTAGNRQGSLLSRSQQQSISRFAQDALMDEVNNALESGALSLGRADVKSSAFAVQSICMLCVVAFSMVSGSDGPTVQAIRRATSALCGRLRDAVSHNERESATALRQVMAASVAALLPSDLKNGEELSMGIVGAIQATREIGCSFWTFSRKFDKSDPEDIDLMDLDREFESQQSRSRQGDDDDNPIRDWLGCQAASKARMSCRLMKALLWSSPDTSQADRPGLTQGMLKQFSKELEHLACSNFLASSGLLCNILGSDAGLDVSFALPVLKYAANKIMGDYEIGQSEAADSTASTILAATATLWPHSNKKLRGVVQQMYKHFVSNVMKHHKRSPHELICMMNLLDRAMNNMPDFLLDDETLASPRTCLLTILEESPASVKFAMGPTISSMFSRFLLRDHQGLLNDVLGSLPLEPDWPEGAAVRLTVLMELGGSWSTLMRRCLYTIVEAPAVVSGCSQYAKACLQRLSIRMGLESPRALFNLFVPQILYTWIRNQTLGSLPHDIFDYASLPDLLRDVQDEIVAQTFMRGREAEAYELAGFLGREMSALVEQSFGRCAAYCVAWDAAVKPDEDEMASQGTARLMKTVGKKKNAQHMRERFPEILATLFKILEREDSISKTFQQRPHYESAHSAFEEIVSSGSAVARVNVSQQPSFTSACLLDEIEYVCESSKYNSDKLWTPALYTYVFREIANTIHPALGELNTCSVIRRLRILVSLAGDVAFSGYPLEMALHCLKQYLKSQQCAEDTISLFRFLLTRGSPYLQQAPGFLLGLLTASLSSLRSILQAPRDSTTQESDFNSTISKAQEFHTWIASFAREFQSPSLDHDGEAIFRRVIMAAEGLRGDGTPSMGTPESDLLLAIFDDRRTENPLLNGPTRSNILSQLCSNFKLPSSHREDILGEHGFSTTYASAVLESLSVGCQSHGYKLWVGRVLGRAYAESGYVDPSLIRETESYVAQGRSASDELSVPPMSAILQRLCDTLPEADQHHVGVAEKAIRVVVNTAQADETLQKSIGDLPASLASSLLWQPFSPQESTTTIESEFRKLPGKADLENATVRKDWARRLCLYLLSTCDDVPELNCLAPVVCDIPTLARELFPFILHLALLNDIDHKVKRVFSKFVIDLFHGPQQTTAEIKKAVLAAILHLRTQEKPQESTQADRCHWLEIDFTLAARVAIGCNMFKTALLLLEIDLSEQVRTKKSRRSSGFVYDMPTDLLLQIFPRLDDKDWFYGLEQSSSLQAVMSQLQYDDTSFKRLSFQSAHLDSKLRLTQAPDMNSEGNMTEILNDLELNGLSRAVISNLNADGGEHSDIVFQTARKLEKWDLSSQLDTETQSTTIFKVFQSLHDTSDKSIIGTSLDSAFQATMGQFSRARATLTGMHDSLETLAVLSETEDVLTSSNAADLKDVVSTLQLRTEWMANQRYVSQCKADRHVAENCKAGFHTDHRLLQAYSVQYAEQREAIAISCKRFGKGSSGIRGPHTSVVFDFESSPWRITGISQQHYVPDTAHRFMPEYGPELRRSHTFRSV